MDQLLFALERRLQNSGYITTQRLLGKKTWQLNIKRGRRILVIYIQDELGLAASAYWPSQLEDWDHPSTPRFSLYHRAGTDLNDWLDSLEEKIRYALR